MVSFKEFNINLKALNHGNTVFHYAITDEFFHFVEALDIIGGDLQAEVVVNKTETYFEINFHIEGNVSIACAKCLDEMQQTIRTEQRLIVRFGHEYSEEDDLIIVPEDDESFDISWFLYEFIQLNIPIKHVHAPGKCNPAMIKMLEEHSVTRSDGREEEQIVDPRWSKLTELKNK